MATENKIITLKEDSQVHSSSNTWWEYVRVYRMSLEWVINDTNEVHTTINQGGDGSMSVGSVQADGDIILSVGWGDGFAVKRLGNTGSVIQLYHDNTPMDGYAYYNNLAIDKVNHKAYVSNYVYDGIMVYDYSDCYGGSDNVLKDGEINPTPDEVGYAYMNGLNLVGDYLYLVADEFSTSTCRRYNTNTTTQDDLSVINFISNGQYGESWYDEDNNRVYIMWRTNGGMWVIINPDKSSTDPIAPAKCYNINLSSLGASDDIYTPTIAPDKDNGNHLWVCGYHGRYFKIDITDILNESSNVPLLLDRHDFFYNKINQYSPMALTGYNSGRPHPTYKSDLILIKPDRDCNMNFGWLDTENMLPVVNTFRWKYEGDGGSAYRYDSSDNIYYSYAGFPILAESSNGIKYWLTSGYGADGYKTRVYSEDTNGLTLKDEGYITFGNFQLDNTDNIKSIQINYLKNNVYTPTDCRFDVLVSNNSGSTWDTYNWRSEYKHEFNSTGNSVQVKFLFTGNGMGTKCPYVWTYDSTKIVITISNENVGKGYSNTGLKKIKGS